MHSPLATICISLGILSALLVPWTPVLARRLWPGPTVKGPADVYVQAFQRLLVLAVLGLSCLLLCVVALIASLRSSWTLGACLSAAPLLVLAAAVALTTVRRR